MEALVMGWYVLTLTDNPFLVGLTWTARMSLNIFALFAGAIADRLPRNRILAAVEFIIAILGVIMIALILSGHIQVWHIFGVAMAAGVVRVFQMPTAQSLVADTLPQERIGNGAAFNSVGMNLAMLLGPLIGGVLFKSYGPEGAYAMITGLYCLSGFAALSIRLDKKPATAGREPVLRSIISGLKYVKGEQIIWGTLMVAIIIEFFGWTFHTSLIPSFARDVLGTDSAGLGVLMFAFGAGSMTAALLLPRVLDALPDRPVMFGGAALMVATLLGLGATVLTAGLGWFILLGAWLLVGLGYSAVLTPSGRLLRRSAHAGDRPALFAAQFALSHACWLVTYPLSGWLLTPFLQNAGMETVMRMRKRVLDNLTTTFKSDYAKTVTLEGMLEKDAVLQYRQMRTGEKYLVTPHG